MTKKTFVNQEEVAKKFITTSEDDNKIEQKNETQKILLNINSEAYYKIKILAATNKTTATKTLNKIISDFIEKEGL